MQQQNPLERKQQSPPNIQKGQTEFPTAKFEDYATAGSTELTTMAEKLLVAVVICEVGLHSCCIRGHI
jgi:hypothetical protein